MDLGLNQKVAIVCAASKGLGRACATALAHEGVKVVICARNAQALNEAARQQYVLKVAHGYCLSFAIFTSEEDIERLVEKGVEEFGTVDILVTNVGTPADGRILRPNGGGVAVRL